MRIIIENEKEILETSFVMKDYLETKSFLIEDLYTKNKEASVIVLENELLFLILGSDQNISPIDTAAAILVNMLNIKELQKKGLDILNEKSIVTAEVK